MDKKFDVNIDINDVFAQYQQEQEQQQKAVVVKKTKFDEKNYLNVRLGENEPSKTMTIRLLPFSKDGGSPFFKVHMHTVKVNRKVSPSGWKTFVCPVNNLNDGNPMGEKCPFCETSKAAKNLKFNTSDEATRKKYSDIEFMNRPKEMWVVRCIERGHEEDGVKFWMFPSSKKRDGVFDKMHNLATIRAESAKRKGNTYNIFDIHNGLDLILTFSKTTDNKTSVQIVDEGIPSPLTEDVELGMKWINDEKKWYEVYTVKPYEFMEIIVNGGVPIYNKEKGCYMDEAQIEAEKDLALAKKMEEHNASTPESAVDYSEIF